MAIGSLNVLILSNDSCGQTEESVTYVIEMADILQAVHTTQPEGQLATNNEGEDKD